MCQFPFPMSVHQAADLWNNLAGYECILVNSRFTHDVLRTRINAFHHDIEIKVLPPPVPIETNPSARTAASGGKVVILSIGRFFLGGHNKRHDVLIEALKRLHRFVDGAELHLVGSLHPGPEHVRHFNTLLRQAQDLPIHFHANATPRVLSGLLQTATIYWHATGFEVDTAIHPEKCEHFGISIVEAMAAGCVPFVVRNGGPPDFVREGETGFQYDNIDELVGKTRALLGNPSQVTALSARAREEAGQFAEATFMQRWREIASTRQTAVPETAS